MFGIYEIERFNDVYNITVRPFLTSIASGGTVTLTVDQFSRFERWRSGEGLIHTMLYDLSADNRELLLSGMNNDDWKLKIGDDEDV